LERSGDLAEHIAHRAAVEISAELTPLLRALIHEISRLNVEMWQSISVAFARRERDIAERVSERDDEIDDLHVRLLEDSVDRSLPLSMAIDLSLVGRFYERLGDHAVNVAKRVSEKVTSLPAA
jgi:phosphate transport system protein